MSWHKEYFRKAANIKYIQIWEIFFFKCSISIQPDKKDFGYQNSWYFYLETDLLHYICHEMGNLFLQYLCLKWLSFLTYLCFTILAQKKSSIFAASLDLIFNHSLFMVKNSTLISQKFEFNVTILMIKLMPFLNMSLK